MSSQTTSVAIISLTDYSIPEFKSILQTDFYSLCPILCMKNWGILRKKLEVSTNIECLLWTA